MTLHEALKAYIQSEYENGPRARMSWQDIEQEADRLLKIIDPFVIAYVHPDVKNAYEEYHKQ